MRPVLYYVHHHGLGHWRRGLAVAARLARPVIFAATTPPPQPLPESARWLRLPPDFPGPPDRTDHDAYGRLHWAPTRHAGLLRRHQLLLAEATRRRPVLAVVDVSVEVTVLLRTSGIPTIAVRLPGERDDEAHQLGFGLADEVVMPVPEAWGMHTGRARTRAVGLVGADRTETEQLPTGGRGRGQARAQGRGQGRPRVVIVVGSGGSRLSGSQCQQIAVELSDYEVRVLGLEAGPGGSTAAANLTFVGRLQDPRGELAAASVVIGNAGLGTVSDVVSSRRPFVVVPEERPFGEQQATGRSLHAGRDAVVLTELPELGGWREAVLQAAARGPALLSTDGADRFARLIERRAQQIEHRAHEIELGSDEPERVITLPIPAPTGPGRS